MASVCEGYTPPNTSKNTDWSVRVLDEWRKARPITGDEEQCPENLLECPVAEKLDYISVTIAAIILIEDANH